MLIIAPWRTDAPVYHRPWATLGLILACVAVYAFLGTPDPERVQVLAGTTFHGGGDAVVNSRKRRELQKKIHRAAAEREAREAAAKEEHA